MVLVCYQMLSKYSLLISLPSTHKEDIQLLSETKVILKAASHLHDKQNKINKE